MMRVSLVVFATLALAACAPPVPDSGAEQARGVGFENYDTYLARQQAEAQARAAGTQTTVQPPAQSEAQATASAAVAAVRGTSDAAQTVTTTAAAAPPRLNNPGISDEQDFDAVSSRESIESDAQRRQAQSAQYKVIAPTQLPSRPSGAAPTPIQFALSTSHPVGQRVYGRGLASKRKAAAACAGYVSDEAAQDQFLKNGGPEKDKLGLDPDGDGYACNWNPAIYRGLTRQSG